MKRAQRLGLIVLVAFLAGCSQRPAEESSASSPAVAAPAVSPPAVESKHYAAADFAAGCFTYPSAETLKNDLQIARMAGRPMTTQEVIDTEYKQDLSVAPTGLCATNSRPATPVVRRPQQGSDGGWIENAKNNDMSHYGDALPGSKH